MTHPTAAAAARLRRRSLLAGCSTTRTNDGYSSLPPSPAAIPGQSADGPRDGHDPGRLAPTYRDVPHLPPDQYADLLDRIRAGYALPDVAALRGRPRGRVLPQRSRTSSTARSGAARATCTTSCSEIEKRGMPLELALLPVVESAFNPVAYSRSRASGLWQFIPSIGQALRPRAELVDRRAARRDRRHRRRAHLPAVPATRTSAATGTSRSPPTTAAKAPSAAPCSRNAGARAADRLLQPRPAGRDARLRAEAARHQPHRAQPGSLRPAVRGDPEPAVLRRRRTRAGRCTSARRRSSPASRRDDMFALNPGLQPHDDAAERPASLLLPVPNARAVPPGDARPDDGAARAASRSPRSSRRREVRHKVRRGETLSAIARQYGVPMTAIRQANDMRGSVIHPGESLLIPAGLAGSTATLARTGRRAARRHHGPVAGAPEAAPPRSRSPSVHVVKSGDTLWGVARKYGVTMPALAAANGLSSKSQPDRRRTARDPGPRRERRERQRVRHREHAHDLQGAAAATRSPRSPTASTSRCASS